MAETKKTVEISKTDDFRRVEVHTEEIVDGNVTQRIITTKNELIPMVVTKVQKETIMPVVTNRVVENYEEGKLVSTEEEVLAEDHASEEEIEKRIQAEVAKRLADINQPIVAKLGESVCCSQPTTPARELIEKRNGYSLSLSFDWTYILYTLMACETAYLIYKTVLKGWLLNL